MLADRFGLHKDAVLRHAANHLSPAMRAAILNVQKPLAISPDELRTREEQGLLAAFVTQRARLLIDAERSREYGDMRSAIAAEKAYLDNLGVVARIVGQLSTVHSVVHSGSVELLTSPAWLQAADVIRMALQAFPDAAIAVARALHELDLQAADEITNAAQRKPPLTIEHDPAHAATIAPPPY